MTRVNDWLQLLRISNAPTCVSNVLVGCTIGLASLPQSDIGPFIDPGSVLLVIAGVFGFYLGGMALNDVFDAKHDRALGTPRPIAMGRIGQVPATIVAVLLLLAGVAGTGLAGGIPGLITGLALLACIVLYDAWHRWTVPAMLLMALCRGLVYVAAAFAVTDQPDPALLAVFSLGLGLHTAIVTGIARTERTSRSPSAWYMALLPLAPCGVLFLDKDAELWGAGVFGVILALWFGRIVACLNATPPRTIPAVLAGLSGIALLDAFYLAILGGWILSLLAVACFALTALAHRSISGT